LDFNVRCKTCGHTIGHYEGRPFILLADTTIGGHIVFVELGNKEDVGHGNAGLKILCGHCLALEHPGTIKREDDIQER